MAVPTNAILRVVASMLMPNSVIAQNVFFALFLNDGGSDLEADVIGDLADWVDDILSQVETRMEQNIVPTDIRVYIYDAVDADWDEVGSDALTYTPSSIDEMLPHGVAAIIYARTEDPDVLGMKYLAGFSEDSQADGSWGSGTTSAMLLAGAQWVTDHIGAASGSTFEPGVWSVAQSAFIGMSGVFGANGIVGYQRRRKAGVGI